MSQCWPLQGLSVMQKAVLISLGSDVSGRDGVLKQAVAAAQLTHEQVAEHLALPPAIPAFNPVALLAGTVEASPTADARICC